MTKTFARSSIQAFPALMDDALSAENLSVLEAPGKGEYQGDHGICRANYRCCIPALAGFVSPQSMGPGRTIKEQLGDGIKLYYSNLIQPKRSGR